MQINNEITLAEFSFPSQFVVLGLLATSARRRLDFRSQCGARAALSRTKSCAIGSNPHINCSCKRA
jgi:hypothetical protein